MDARSFTFRSQRHYRPSSVYKLQELCRRVLIAHFTLTGWKSATQRLSGRARREAALIPSSHFFGCSVNFFLQPKFSKSGHPSYQVKCLLDQTWYLAIRVQDRRPEHILEDEEFWRWAWPVHRHLLSALAVAVDAPSSSVYIITVLPDDRLERVALELAASALCVAETNLWKFLLQLCSWSRAENERRKCSPALVEARRGRGPDPPEHPIVRPPSHANSTSFPGPRFYRVNAGVRPPVKPWPPQKQAPQTFSAGPPDSDETFAGAAKSTKWPKENEISSEEATTTLSSAPEM
ncbi:hypothetical protein HPB48_007913 [Haemaphysalis longicornis]|uniref:Uncharacterized protein n=1 Tax=Haemaphysalis longicornis TaxID=44386 RepID=A0A9J6GA43_HAELO|nr:hypothetical protein HPB48_007913 [Haemaphysalis longicornis]